MGCVGLYGFLGRGAELALKEACSLAFGSVRDASKKFILLSTDASANLIAASEPQTPNTNYTSNGPSHMIPS